MMNHQKFKIRTLVLACSILVLSGCASLSSDGNIADLQTLTTGKTAGTAIDLSAVQKDRMQSSNLAEALQKRQETVNALLVQPLTAESAIRIAMLSSPRMGAALTRLNISDADRVQAGRLPNPHVAFARLFEGQTREIERMLSFNLLGILTLPWQAEFKSNQHELAKMTAAGDVVQLAADTKKAWFRAVAAAQSVSYLEDAKEAASAGAELARRMAQVGNFSRLQQAQEQALVLDASLALARAQKAAASERERLIRLLGLWGEQTQFVLPDRLPDLPKLAAEHADIEGAALRERLDVRSALAATDYTAKTLGFTKVTGFVSGLEIGLKTKDKSNMLTGTLDRTRGWELAVPIPIFDWGQARNARAQTQYLQSVERVHDTAVQARSEVREAWFGYRSSHDIARQYLDRIVPLRQFMQAETQLRYNGMLVSSWDLLADMRINIRTIVSTIEAQRDYWLAETDLQTAMTAGSPSGLGASMASSAAGLPAEPKGH